MTETKSKDPEAPVSSPAADPARLRPFSEMAKTPTTIPETETATAAEGPAVDEAKPLETRPWRAATTPARVNYLWIVLPIVLLLAILVFFMIRPRTGVREDVVATTPQVGEAEPDLSNYSDFVAKNKELIEKASEQALTDEPFAGQAPLAVRSAGPLVSSEIDPQLAALIDALRIRVQIMQGNPAPARDSAGPQVTKGEFRGFKVQAVEKREDGKTVFEEATVVTPKNGLIKTAGRVLAAMQRTDHAGLMSEVRDAGMEFLPLSVQDGKNNFRGQLRLLRPWGKPIPADRLISGESVGRVSLGMPLSQLKDRIAPTDSVLKRKVLINDVYRDVYKVSDLGGNALFFVYEKERKVMGIWVVSESFKTGRNIGINYSLDQIRIHYPTVELSRSGKRPPVVKVDDVSGFLILQGDGDRKVVAILIGDSPEFN